MDRADRQHYPSEPLRLKLLGLGIPHDQHGAAALRALLPQPADSRALDEFDADGLASIVAYLTSKGLLGIRSIADGEMGWGAHVCQFYRSHQELLDLVVPYFKSGLERNEYCVWVVSSLTVEEAGRLLEGAVPRFAEYRSQIELHAYTDWYLTARGSLRPLKDILARWVERERVARERGFTGLRISGDTHGLRASAWREFMNYEGAVHAALHERRIKAICTYPALHTPEGCALNDVMSVHGAMVTRGDGRWQWTAIPDGKGSPAAGPSGT